MRVRIISIQSRISPVQVSLSSSPASMAITASKMESTSAVAGTPCPVDDEDDPLLVELLGETEDWIEDSKAREREEAPARTPPGEGDYLVMCHLTNRTG